MPPRSDRIRMADFKPGRENEARDEEGSSGDKLNLVAAERCETTLAQRPTPYSTVVRHDDVPL